MTTSQIQLLSLKQVCQLTSLSRTGVNKARAGGRFPAAVAVDGRRIAFVKKEVEAWLASKIEARNAKAPK